MEGCESIVAGQLFKRLEAEGKNIIRKRPPSLLPFPQASSNKIQFKPLKNLRSLRPLPVKREQKREVQNQNKLFEERASKRLNTHSGTL